MDPIGRRELWHAQIALLVAIALQLAVADKLRIWPKFSIATLELLLVFAIGFTAPRRHSTAERMHKFIATVLIALVSLANTVQLFLLIKTLIVGPKLPGVALLTSSFAIFLTNILMFALWYWELDSPGLSGRRRQDGIVHFQFPQTVSAKTKWRPAFFDYLYVALTNSTAFSPTDTMPLTHSAKFLMSTQSLVSLFTVVLVTARAVNILG